MAQIGTSIDYLRLAAFVAYLAAWVVFAVGTILISVPKGNREPSVSSLLQPPVIVGTILQILPALGITLSLTDAPLRPSRAELGGILACAVFGSSLFFAAVLSSLRNSGSTLVTTGIYSWM